MKRNVKHCLTGLIAGVLNGLFGAGGGVAVVPLLEHTGIPAQKAHATSIAIIAPLSLLSGFLYLQGGHVDLKQALVYLPFGVIGAVTGAFLLKKISNQWLKRIFGVVMILSAIRLFCR